MADSPNQPASPDYSHCLKGVGGAPSKDRPRLPVLGACGCGPSCRCGCQSGGPCQCGGCCG